MNRHRWKVRGHESFQNKVGPIPERFKTFGHPRDTEAWLQRLLPNNSIYCLAMGYLSDVSETAITSKASVHYALMQYQTHYLSRCTCRSSLCQGDETTGWRRFMCTDTHFHADNYYLVAFSEIYQGSCQLLSACLLLFFSLSRIDAFL